MDQGYFSEFCFRLLPFASSTCLDPLFLVNAALAVLLMIGVVAGAGLYHLWRARASKAAPPQAPSADRRSEAGNVFFAIFAAVGMVALLGVALTNLMQGPITSVSKVTRVNVALNDMQAAVAVITQASLVAPDADCDDDGFIEPLPFRDAGAASAPSGGGLLPLSTAVNRRDPWGTDYGYCVWDHGGKVLDDSCGGADAMRRGGGNTQEAAAIAVMSAGPDKIFQTACEDWIDNDTPVVNKVSGSDDMWRIIPYAQMMVPASTTNARLQELPDGACNENTIGIMRLFLGTAQICLADGWVEIDDVSVESAGDFIDITGAEPASKEHLSGTISFSGFRGTRPLTVQGAATLLINGNPVTAPAAVSDGDTIELRADAPGNPGETSTFSIMMSGIRKEWKIETRAAYPPSLSITPNAAAINVTGPGNPAYSDLTGFVVRNTGEQATGVLQAAQLVPLSNYEFSGDGDDCGGVTLEPYAKSAAQCTVDIRAKSSGEAIPSGTLTVTDGASANATATLSGTAGGFNCTLAGVTVAHGASSTFYSATAHTDCASVSQTRTCNSGVLSGSGSYQYASCDTLANCTLNGVTVAHGASRTFYSATIHTNCASVSLSRTCNNGTLSGSGSYQYASCNAPANCTLGGVTVAHGTSRTFYAATSHSNCASVSQTRTCNNGTLSGSGSYQYANCTLSCVPYAGQICDYTCSIVCSGCGGCANAPNSVWGYSSAGGWGCISSGGAGRYGCWPGGSGTGNLRYYACDGSCP